MWQELALKPQLSAKKPIRDLGRGGVVAEEAVQERERCRRKREADDKRKWRESVSL